MAMIHLFTAATAWHNEPIKIHVCPPTGKGVCGLNGQMPLWCSGADLKGVGGPQTSPSEPQESWPQLHLAIRDLNNSQLRELLDEIQLETVRGRDGTPN